MAPESISIATCIDAIFPNLSGDQRQTICDKLENEFIFNQEDLKDYTVDELHFKVKVPLHAAKKLESSGLLKVPAAPTEEESHRAKVRKTLSDEDRIVALYTQHAPSSMTQLIVKGVQHPSSGDGPLFRCDRPLAGTLPGPLLHPVFGEFEDNLHDPRRLTRDDYAFVNELCQETEIFYKKEIDRQTVILSLLEQYLRTAISSPKIEPGSSISCDGCIKGNSSFPIYAILVVENELGSTSTLKVFQGQSYYARFCIQGMKSTSFMFSTCPTFLIEILGPHIRLSAMTFQERVTSTFLTDVVNIVHSNSMKLASVFKALKLGLESLQAFYDNILDKAEGSSRSSRLPFLNENVPYSLWFEPKYSFKKQIGGKQLVFLAEDAKKREVVIKFCRRYGDKVHKAWYESGFAPELLEVQNLAGGFYLVAMEYLGDPWKPLLSLGVVAQEECRSVVLEALKQVHGLPVFGEMNAVNAGSVHGDARECNIMVRRKERGFEVKFIDFDWAGQENVARYPFQMNHAEIAWPDGVSDGMPMQQWHDLRVASKPLGPSSYRWRKQV